MSGTLYLIGTPIGNLEDITLRQLRMLEEVDFICAEDTRVTLKLLNRYEIKKHSKTAKTAGSLPMQECHVYRIRERCLLSFVRKIRLT